MAPEPFPDAGLQERLRTLVRDLMLIPGLSGHEDRVRRELAKHLDRMGVPSRSDRLGNLIATLPGEPSAPSVMLFAHMDQLGLIVRKIESNGLIRVERLGGVPERALPAQSVIFCTDQGDRPGVIANKSHHATAPEEKYRVLPYPELTVDGGFDSAADALAAGIEIGTPLVYKPNVVELAGGKIAGTSVDDRAGCAVIIEVARALRDARDRPTIHCVFSVMEEFNLRGALTAAQALRPDIAVQLDIMLATDTPDMAARGDVRLGGGPGDQPLQLSRSRHPQWNDPSPGARPPLRNIRRAGRTSRCSAVRRSASSPTRSYVQLVGEGVAAIDLGFPTRYTHSCIGGLRSRLTSRSFDPPARRRGS